MRGQENIIKLRSKGFKPSGSIWICDYPVNPVFIEWSHTEDFKNPTVCTHGDELSSLDLRFVIGLAVHVNGGNSSRVKSLAAACRKAEAMSVIASDGKRYAAWKKGDAKWLTF